jgi:hypothetical protein
LQIVQLFDYEVFEIEPRPFDDSELCDLLSEAWLGHSKFGEPGENLFHYYVAIEGDDETDFEGLRERTLELLREIESGIPDNHPMLALRHFMSLHRFYALLLIQSLVPYEKVIQSLRTFVSSTFQWLINYLRDFLFPIFLAALAGGDTSAPRNKISGFRDSLVDPPGQFIRERFLVAVDMDLANRMVTEGQLTTVQSVLEMSDRFTEFCAALELRMPFFAESLSFTLNYRTIIKDSIRFAEIAPDLPMDFLLGLLFAGKHKRIIPLEISDRRILSAAEQHQVDVAHVDEFRLRFDESTHDIPSTLWMTTA